MIIVQSDRKSRRWPASAVLPCLPLLAQLQRTDLPPPDDVAADTGTESPDGSAAHDEGDDGGSVDPTASHDTKSDQETDEEGGDGGSDADPCALPEHQDALVLGDRFELPDEGQAIASGFRGVAICGRGFVAHLEDLPGRMLQTLEVEGLQVCRALSDAGNDRVLALTRQELLLLELDEERAPRLLDRIEHRLPSAAMTARSPRKTSARGPYGLAVDGERGWLAAGADGLIELALSGDAITLGTKLEGALEPRDVALTPRGLLVADGLEGLRLLDPDDGSELGHIPLDFGFAHGLTVVTQNGGARHLVALARMGWGVQLYQLDDEGLVQLGNKVPQGAVSSIALQGDQLITANQSKLVRYRLAGDSLLPVDFEARPRRGELEGGWFRGVAGSALISTGDDPPNIYALEGASVRRVELPRPDEDPAPIFASRTLLFRCGARPETKSSRALHCSTMPDMEISSSPAWRPTDPSRFGSTPKIFNPERAARSSGSCPPVADSWPISNTSPTEPTPPANCESTVPTPTAQCLPWVSRGTAPTPRSANRPLASPSSPATEMPSPSPSTSARSYSSNR